MIQAARDRILSAVEPMASLELPLQEAWGCVLAADVVAEFDVPEFSSSLADGFAVRASDVFAASEAAPAALSIVGTSTVGHHPDSTVGWGEAVRIAAGAPMPAGSDSVVPLARCVLEGETVRILGGEDASANVLPAGTEVRAGQILVPGGRRLAAPELSLLASTGRPSALVFPKPRAVVLAVGDAVVEPGRPASYGQSRDAASFSLYGALRDVGAVPYLAGIVPDDVDRFQEQILEHSLTADCFISAGGRAIASLSELQRVFFKRASIEAVDADMDPEPPRAFGLIEGKPYFGLPDDPAAVLVAFEVFVRPALLTMMGRRDRHRPEVRAVLTGSIPTYPGRARYAPARVWLEDGRWYVRGAGDAGDGTSTLADANGVAVIPAEFGGAPSGAEIRVMVFRPLEP